MPKPPEYARVGGQWDKLSKRIDQLKEGLSRILALIPYDLVSFEVWSPVPRSSRSDPLCLQTWDRIMPHWLEAISTEIPEDNLSELKVLLWYDVIALTPPPTPSKVILSAKFSKWTCAHSDSPRNKSIISSVADCHREITRNKSRPSIGSRYPVWVPASTVLD